MLTEKPIWPTGILGTLIGVVIILLSLIFDSPSNGPYLHTLVKLLDVIGIAIFAVALINILIETKDWSDYFGRRIREIVVEQSYLNTLDRQKLDLLLTGVLKAQFKDQEIDREGSFLNYLHANLHHYIAEPYREDVTAEIIYTEGGKDAWDVFDRVTYTCRKSSAGIQTNVTSKTDPGEYLSSDSLKVEVQFPYTHADRGKRVVLYEQKPELGQETIVSLEQYAREDGLIVIISEKYRISKNRFEYWTMTHPTKNFDITITYPADYEIQVKPMVLSPDLVLATEAAGYYKAKYDFWMLPESGMAWTIVPRNMGA